VGSVVVAGLGGGFVVGVKVEVFIIAFHAEPDVHVRHLHSIA
jgi:hypothetical protein